MAGPVIISFTPPTPLAPTHNHRDERPRPRHSLSPSRRFERRLIRLWKRMTRRNERASILPDGFVLMNEAAARRRSLCMAPAKLKRSRPAHLAP